MAAVARTPGRPLRAAANAATEPPNKRRKYIPGGVGGGGRWIDGDGNDITSMTLTAPRPRNPRSQASLLKVNEERGDSPTVTRPAMPTRPRRERPQRSTPQSANPRPRYSNAAAAAAASQASDGYKPREERSWEDFHPDLDVDVGLSIFTADEVDGKKAKDAVRPNLAQSLSLMSDTKSAIADVEMKDVPPDETADDLPQNIMVTPTKRKPGRPPRRPESMLSGLGSPPAPRILPLPTHNPKERLNLPKPSFRHENHFLQYEDDQKENKMNYVDRTMSSVGYQESDRFEMPSKVLIRPTDGQQVEDEAEVSLRLESDGPAENAPANTVVGRVEYDMDEQDVAWLEEFNEQRKAEGVDAIKPAIFEITMTLIEKEYHALEKRIPKPQPRHAQTHRPRSSSQAAVNGDPPVGDEPDSKCSICDDGDCENANAIIFCDGCDLAVHQECYGVPFIPEGQWFCRKCKEIGRGTPTCIFCPNVDGAFKQTSTLRWSHLLCSIWIPEVTIANATFMEPITDVDKVPKGRWKLNCYICNQKMGACIQCGNKNCFAAFHVTCARRAKLFLKMKSQHQAGIDSSALKAFCDKHVPPEWRRTHDTDHAIVEAKRWYKHAMKDRRWADSQTAALELGAAPFADGGMTGDGNQADDTIAVTKRKRNQPAKMSWRLPSGAPVVPAVVYGSVEASLTRFTVRKRKEFVERAAKYWTLKREARRGAALLKRLQLQLESFSSMEITRRNFAGMGAVGRPRLVRRIEFAEMLQKDMGFVTDLSSMVKERELLHLQEIQSLRELLDTVYFPITPLLVPILQRAQKIDEKTRMFKDGLELLGQRLRERYYTSVSWFSRDFSLEIGKVLAKSENLADTTDIQAINYHLLETKPGTAEHLALTQEQKEVKKLAKRLVKAINDPLMEARRKEADLRGHAHEEELRKLDSMGIFSSSMKGMEADEVEDGKGVRELRSGSNASAVAGASLDPGETADTVMPDADQITDEAVIHLQVAGKPDTIPIIPNNKHTPTSKAGSCSSSGHEHPTKPRSEKPTEPLSPPISTGSHALKEVNSTPTDPSDVLANGGVPWYLGPFDISGTTVHDERYTGRAVLREMSEELSDMDEDTLTELAPSRVEMTPNGKAVPAKSTEDPDPVERTKRTAPAASKRKRRR